METTKTKKGLVIKKINPKAWNIYKPKDIVAVGGIEKFSQLIGNDKEIELPKFDFTEQEWEEMLKKGI
ncbi:MAG: hypothetical protein MUF58_21555 [Arcicella sp.]|jgi:hypothetical protein|nr:hypothetical protein [Microscillaceae bacterium]MCU0471174.1 hypothetical protein [Arcicella sp.]